MSYTNWNKQLANAAHDDTIIAKAPADEAVWNRNFDSDFGAAEGEPVLAWSKNYVYFPVCYDGAEWIDRVPRNPIRYGFNHVGGG